MALRSFFGMMHRIQLAASLKNMDIDQLMMQGITLVLSWLLLSGMENGIVRVLGRITWWRFSADCQRFLLQVKISLSGSPAMANFLVQKPRIN
jgi:hypothetical protein